MSELNFRALQNGFESQTSGSHKKAMNFSSDTIGKLQVKTDAGRVAIYNAYLPFHNAYANLNLAVEIAEGTYEGKTLSFENIMDTLPDKLRQWEPPIHILFPEDSAMEKEIFPNKRTPFYHGTYQQRLQSVAALRDKLLDLMVANTSLIPVQADVAAFYTLANTARLVQTGQEGDLGELRAQREEQRIVTMNAYWGIVYGGMLSLYYETPGQIAEIIDFEMLYEYSTEELFATVSVPGNNIVVNVPLSDWTITPATRIRLKNKNEQPGEIAIIYFAADPTKNPGNPPVGMVLNPGDSRIVTAQQLGYDTTATFLNLFSPVSFKMVVEIWEVK